MHLSPFVANHNYVYNKNLIQNPPTVKKKFITLDDDGEYTDKYTVFIPDVFLQALQTYTTTTGNSDMYCNFVQYSIQGTTPTFDEKCKKDIIIPQQQF